VTRNVTPPPDSTPGIERLDGDALTHAGVSHVVVFMGTNDIRREANAKQVITQSRRSGLQCLAGCRRHFWFYTAFVRR
jgi:hypothetical protein